MAALEKAATAEAKLVASRKSLTEVGLEETFAADAYRGTSGEIYPMENERIVSIILNIQEVGYIARCAETVAELASDADEIDLGEPDGFGVGQGFSLSTWR